MKMLFSFSFLFIFCLMQISTFLLLLLQSCTVVVENLPEDHSHQNLDKIFNVVGRLFFVTSIPIYSKLYVLKVLLQHILILF